MLLLNNNVLIYILTKFLKPLYDSDADVNPEAISKEYHRKVFPDPG